MEEASFQCLVRFTMPYPENEADRSRYHSVRIDTVHYCSREEELAEKRKHRSRFDRNADPHDPTRARLSLLCRTLRDSTSSPSLGSLVVFLKTPYMTRESCKADLARTVTVMPNLKYVDLPDGVYSDDPSCLTLMMAVQHRCKDLRKMTYLSGGERLLETLGTGTAWQSLEIIELQGLNADSTLLRRAVGGLSNLRVMKVSNMKSFDDTIFDDNPMLPPFPALQTLHLEEMHNVTAAGLVTYLQHPFNANRLTSLSLKATGVLPHQLHSIVSAAPRLADLSVYETVAHGMPADPSILPLSSQSLRTMHYEIVSVSSANTYKSASASYYAYLTSSLLGCGLPSLKYLYVRDPDFPESLLALAPPSTSFAANEPPSNPFTPSHNRRFSSNNPFAAAAESSLSPKSASRQNLGLNQELEVYSKGLDEMEWNYVNVKPADKPGRRGSATTPRPLSLHGLSADFTKPWNRGDARRSVIVGNGFGGFLAVPDEEGPRPSSSAGERGKKSDKADLWR